MPGRRITPKFILRLTDDRCARIEKPSRRMMGERNSIPTTSRTCEDDKCLPLVFVIVVVSLTGLQAKQNKGTKSRSIPTRKWWSAHGKMASDILGGGKTTTPKVAGSAGHRHVPQHDSDQPLCTRSMMHQLHATRGRQVMQSQPRLYSQKISSNGRGYRRLTKRKFKTTIGESDNLLRKREVEIKVFCNIKKASRMRLLGAYNRQHRRLRILRLK
jgi:hypothetical protein